tara:strand:+ start:2067 stop:2384 length:318 start_codon:yes stop_codon:yes gene_type:complete
MINLFIFTLGCVGLTIILTSSSLFDRARLFLGSKSELIGELAQCPMCLGFWVGAVTSYLAMENAFIYSIYYGGVISFLSYFLATITGLINNISYMIEMNYGEEDE